MALWSIRPPWGVFARQLGKSFRSKYSGPFHLWFIKNLARFLEHATQKTLFKNSSKIGLTTSAF